MAYIQDGVLIRRCRVCEITSDLIAFSKQKSSRNGKVYIHNICVPCRLSYNNSKRNRLKGIENASRWNRENRERYNNRRRKPWVLKGISHYGRKK